MRGCRCRFHLSSRGRRMTERPQTTPNRVEITEEQRRQILRELNRPRSRLRMFVDWAKSLVVAIVLFLLIRTVLVEAFKVPTGSMERTLLVGDFRLVNKAVYGAEIAFPRAHLPPVARPQRGDIIVFEWPKDPPKHFVKRLIGLPGDTLEMSEGVVRLNGKPFDELYVDHTA